MVLKKKKIISKNLPFIGQKMIDTLDILLNWLQCLLVNKTLQ